MYQRFYKDSPALVAFKRSWAGRAPNQQFQSADGPNRHAHCAGQDFSSQFLKHGQSRFYWPWGHACGSLHWQGINEKRGRLPWPHPPLMTQICTSTFNNIVLLIFSYFSNQSRSTAIILKQGITGFSTVYFFLLENMVIFLPAIFQKKGKRQNLPLPIIIRALIF